MSEGFLVQLSVASISLLSAALRHVRDAEHLADIGSDHLSLDQAFHLAGYGPECARKATLGGRSFDRLLGHRLSETAEPIIEVALALDPVARRYDPEGWSARFPEFTSWSEQSRYEPTGARRRTEVKALLSAAREAVDDVVLALWSDGRLEEIP